MGLQIALDMSILNYKMPNHVLGMSKKYNDCIDCNIERDDHWTI